MYSAKSSVPFPSASDTRMLGTPDSLASSDGRIAISVVDDDENECSMMKRVLDQIPKLVWVATYHSGEEALAGMPESATKIVLLDIRMPGMSGIEVLQRLKTNCPEMIVIIVTGLDDPRAIAAALATGADHHLTKPLLVGQLSVAVAFCLNRRVGRDLVSAHSARGRQAGTHWLSSTDHIEGLTAVLARCLSRARSWRVPPNWSAEEWFGELEAQAAVSVFRAGRDYDASRGLSLDVFVYFHVLADLLSRYRKEWSYALHSAPSLSESGEFARNPDLFPTGEPFREHSSAVSDAELREAIARLPPMSRELIEQLYWQERNEAAVAEELAISQQAVSKRKQAILRNLRQWLDSSENASGCKTGGCCNL